jgi:hypothetical protein
MPASTFAGPTITAAATESLLLALVRAQASAATEADRTELRVLELDIRLAQRNDRKKSR